MTIHKHFQLATISIACSLIILIVNLVPVKALPIPNFCFAHAEGASLHTMLFDGTSQQVAPNTSGVSRIEAIAFNPRNQVLYAANADELGTLNYDFTDLANGGTFTAIGGGFGSVNGASGIVAITDVDSLAFDPISGVLYGVDRVGGAPDRLITINIATGAANPNSFGIGIGYIEITDNNAATVWDEDIDDLAIDPTTARLYAIANSGGAGDHLITLDRNTGALTDIGILTSDDMEGLGFFNDGTLYGTTGEASSSSANRNSLWRINLSNANATQIAAFVSDTDYEAVDCLVGDPNNKLGVVFNDVNSNGVLDGGEGPVAGVTIEIYRDDGIVNGAIDVNDTFLGTVLTNAAGMYDFSLAAIGGFILQVDITSLPAGISISDNIEIANFDNCNPGAAPFDDFGCVEPDNNFPSNVTVPTDTPTPTNTPTDVPLPPAPDTPVPTITPDLSMTPGDALLIAAQISRTPQINGLDISIHKTGSPGSVQLGETAIFTITVINPNAQALPNVVITDDVPASFEIIEVLTSQGTASRTGNRVHVDIGTMQARQTVIITIITEAIRVGFVPDTCNSVNIGGGVSNQACPNIFPSVLPQTGESPFGILRLLLIGLAIVLSISTVARFGMRLKV